MRRYIAFLLCFCGFMVISGCDQGTGILPEDDFVSRSPKSGDSVDSVSVQGLTSISEVDEFGRFTKITAYVDILDQYKNNLKRPGLFRFEIYEYLSRQADAKGGRIYMWPDFDLTDPKNNDRHWLESFQSYEFKLQLSSALAKNKEYILLVTFQTPDGRRLSDEFKIGYVSNK